MLQVPFLNKDAPDVRSALHKRLRLPTRTEYDEANEHYLSVYVFAPLLREEAERLWEKEAKRMRKQGKLPLKKTGTEHYRKALEILAKKRGTTVGYLEKRMQYHFKNLGLKFKLERKLRPPPGFESDLEKDEVLKWFDERDALCEQYLKALRVAPRADGFYVERFDPATGTHVQQNWEPFRTEEVAKGFMYDLARADATVRMSAYPASAWPKFPPDDLKAYEVRREEADKDEEAYKAREERWVEYWGQ